MMDSEWPVIVAGAGPVGLSLALGLARQGIRSLVLEARAEPSPYSRAIAVLPRTLEIFRGWGVLESFLDAGQFRSQIPIYVAGDPIPAAGFDLTGLSRHTATPGILVLAQQHTEAILRRMVAETGLVEVRFGHAVTGFREDASGVTVQAAGEEFRASYLAGCDGSHSTVREQLGWHLEGKTYPARILLADVRLADERDELPWPRVAGRQEGILAALRYQREHWRIINPLPPTESDEAAVRPEAIERKVEHLFGPGPFETLWTSVFRIHCRTSPHFRQGRVLLAGDAAHINSPAGGQGMNSGIHDAHNLAWKLARVLEGGSDILLRSYEQERRGVVLADVDRYTDFLTRAVLLSHPWVRAAFLRIGSAALAHPSLMLRIALRAGMLTTCYGESAVISGRGRWVGCRARDGELVAPDGSKRRLLDLAGPDAALLLFDDGRLPSWPREEVQAALARVPRLQVARLLRSGAPETGAYRDADGSLWDAWDATGDTAALLRPDGIVGWAGRRPLSAELVSGVSRALGAQEG